MIMIKFFKDFKEAEKFADSILEGKVSLFGLDESGRWAWYMNLEKMSRRAVGVSGRKLRIGVQYRVLKVQFENCTIKIPVGSTVSMTDILHRF